MRCILAARPSSRQSAGSGATDIRWLALGRRDPCRMRSSLVTIGIVCAGLAMMSSCGRPAGPAPADSSSAAGPLHACAAAQWQLASVVPVGDGPDIFLTLRGRYTSGPRCRLSATLRGTLLRADGRPVAHAAATGVIHAILGPEQPYRQTRLFAFLWSNWCAPKNQIVADIAAMGHSERVVIPQRPMCVNRNEPVGLRWHRM